MLQHALGKLEPNQLLVRIRHNDVKTNRQAQQISLSDDELDHADFHAVRRGEVVDDAIQI